ncbi:Inositol-1,4,5-trisphosphate 5-phosphatase 1 [Linderina macrospora]|uniref:Inositol-1,4,5-trisphosphate 5-phosphatase 1 n=1 Tax=Linderina macrospora TaxID=4868 RepID=A0ACC1J065_9FUNG|nr:Inositol-1,4,5-trisphosphate 5-phosphatase 1 [Linderina macrospora]
MVKHKTGLAGMAGNKGCVAMHLDLDDSSVCIVAAHLAAGASNVQERNNDYVSIQHGARFRRGRRISDHDYAVWLGDLNYRIDLPNDQARRMIAERQVASLMMYDQLGVQMAANNVFTGYREAEIHFPPTYKYDAGTDNYDTSEKVRVPSWTDRILYKGHDVRVLEYYRDELCFSDHKPVLAMMEFDVVSVDKVRKRQITRQLYAKYHQTGDVRTEASGVSMVEQKLIDWDAAISESDSPAGKSGVKSSRAKPPPPPPMAKKRAALPPPSSDSQAWWDDESYVRPTTSDSSGMLSINPYALGRNNMAAPTHSPSSYSANRPPPPVNVLDDNDENLVNLTWEPIQPSHSGDGSRY